MNKSTSGWVNDLDQAHYLLSLHNTFKFIDDHLNEPLSLETVADVAAFSPFHFHRLFKAVTNETLHTYILRKRIEKAAALLIRQSEKTISDIAVLCGFNSHSVFTRAFKKHYHYNPSEFRRLSPNRYAQLKSKKGQTNPIFESYICHIETLKKWIAMNGHIDIKEFNDQTFACLDHIGQDGLPNTFEKLMSWADKKGLLDKSAQFALVYHDSYKITSPENVRMSVSIQIKPKFKPDAGIGTIKIPAGRHIVGRFEIRASEFKTAWSSLFVWMNEHHLKRRDVPPFELYRNNFKEHPEQKFIIDLCIPIV